MPRKTNKKPPRANPKPAADVATVLDDVFQRCLRMRNEMQRVMGIIGDPNTTAHEDCLVHKLRSIAGRTRSMIRCSTDLVRGLYLCQELSDTMS